MSTPCENCGSDLRVCVDCDLYNGKYIEIPDNATNGDVFTEIFGIDAKELNVTYPLRRWFNSLYQKGGKE